MVFGWAQGKFNASLKNYYGGYHWARSRLKRFLLKCTGCSMLCTIVETSLAKLMLSGISKSLSDFAAHDGSGQFELSLES